MAAELSPSQWREVILNKAEIAGLRVDEDNFLGAVVPPRPPNAVATSPIARVRAFAAVQGGPEIGGVEQFQSLLDELAGERFGSLEEMQLFAAQVKHVCRSFSKKQSLVSPKEPQRPGRLDAFLSGGNPWFRLCFPDDNTTTMGSAWEFPELLFVISPAATKKIKSK